jgi:glycerol-3-phosphate dehydrogenase
MSGFARDIAAALEQRHDLIVVGGGIYGMTLTLEAARRGLRPLLVERDDFGGATSLNSLRILHGGLRYLQHLDFRRVFESIEQRSWFMENFKPLCRALPCLMPLYGKGLKRPFIFRGALTLNDLLGRKSPIPGGRVLNADETIGRFPLVRREGLRGAALWHDGQVLSPQRLHAELLRWAVERGARVLNYVEAISLKREGSKAAGVVTTAGEFSAPVVINAAGPWSPEVARRFGCQQTELMTPSLTFNVLLNVPPPSEAAVAVEGSRMYFVTPHRAGLTFAGTVHQVWEGLSEPAEAMLEEFIADLNRAIPGWGVGTSNILRVTAGVLPSKGAGEADMAHRSNFVRHETEGLFSVCGIKYTTAQRFAVEVIDRIFGVLPVNVSGPQIGERSRYVEPGEIMSLDDEALGRFAQEEAVTCVEDLVERRMDWIGDAGERACFEERAGRLFEKAAAGKT